MLRRNLVQFAEETPALFPKEKKVQSAIIPVVLGAAETALSAAEFLSEQGFFVPAIRFPTVPKDTARLRLTVTARHGQKQISAVCEALRQMPQAASLV